MTALYPAEYRPLAFRILDEQHLVYTEDIGRHVIMFWLYKIGFMLYCFYNTPDKKIGIDSVLMHNNSPPAT